MSSDEENLVPAASRREVMKGVGLGLAAATLPGGLAAGVSMGTALVPGPARAAIPEDATMKTIPRTGEKVPAVGMGSYLVFDAFPGDDRTHLHQVMKRFHAGGGRVIDTSPLYGTGEISVGDFATALNITDDLFIANKIWSTGNYLFDDSHALKSLEQSQQRLWRKQFDVMQVHSLTNVAVILPILQGWKNDGLIKNVGITHHEPPYFELLGDWIKKGKPDFVQVHYSIFNRLAEDRILPAAQNVGAAVLVNMPFEKARLFKLVEGQQVPDFAKDFANNWAEFFLKWIIAHPAVTAPIPATSNPEHASENIGALRGPLPDEKMRARMVKYMEDTFPGFKTLNKAPRYPGKKYPGIIAEARTRVREKAKSG